MADDIEKPKHYHAGGVYETWNVIHAWGLNFNLGNVLKYISRVDLKDDPIENLKKAKAYLDREIKLREEKRENAPPWVKEKTRDELVAAIGNALDALAKYDAAHCPPQVGEARLNANQPLVKEV